MEDKIQEIMGLVDSLTASLNEAHMANSEGWRDGCFSAADNIREKIESKLRELVERCSVQEQSTPIQPIVVDDHGVLRFKKNTIVDNLYEHGVKTGYGLNEMYTENHTDEDRMQFAQLIGYSVSGYSTLGYVTDESVNAAFAIANTTKE